MEKSFLKSYQHIILFLKYTIQSSLFRHRGREREKILPLSYIDFKNIFLLIASFMEKFFKEKITQSRDIRIEEIAPCTKKRTNGLYKTRKLFRLLARNFA